VTDGARGAQAQVEGARSGAARVRERAPAARRFVELFDYFDRRGRGARLAEICKHFGWPQSSTTELLNVLLSAGLVYRDEVSRAYQPTPRAALLGGLNQPGFIRDGRLAQMVDSLQARTGLSVALFGRSGLDAQILLSRAAADARLGEALGAGAKFPLIDGAAGWLLLSRMTRERQGTLVRAIRARAGETGVSDGVLRAHCEAAAQFGRLTGPVGAGLDWRMCGVLTPGVGPDRALVLALLFPCEAGRDTGSLEAVLQETVRSGLAPRAETFTVAARPPQRKVRAPATRNPTPAKVRSA
jgi:DNA-binding IclR family transcriptional regulator